MPAAEFTAKYGEQIVQYHAMDLLLGLREDVLHPVVHYFEKIEGGTREPFIQDGKVVKGVATIVGGTKVQARNVAQSDSPLVSYSCGRFVVEDHLRASNICYTYRHVHQRKDFVKWARKLLAWIRKQTPELVPVYRCNYEMRATVALAEACKRGLRLGV